MWTEAGSPGGATSWARAGDTVTNVQGDHPGIFYPMGGFERIVSGALRPRSPSCHAPTQAGKCGEARGPEAAGAQLLLGDAMTFTCFHISVLCFWATDASGPGAGLPCSAPESPPPSSGAPASPARLSCAASRPAGRAGERERGLLPRVCPAPRGEAEVLPRPEAHVPLRRGQCARGVSARPRGPTRSLLPAPLA